MKTVHFRPFVVRALVVSLLGGVLACQLRAAEPAGPARWEKTIAAFEAADKTQPPPAHAILFIGSSTIVRWKTLAQDFPQHTVINRGFGGSQIADSVFYADRIVIPYRPRMIVLRAGGNDIHAGKTPEQVAADFQAFVEKVRAKLPEVRIAYLPINASPSRWANAEREQQANQLIKAYIATGQNLDYIDASAATLGADGKPREDLFVQDRLHFNAEGYKILAAIVRKHLPAPAADGVRIEKDVDYLGPDREEKGDLYLPAQVAEGQRCPAVVIIHGGGWSGGDKGAAREINIGTNLATNGYVGFSINYVLAKGKPTWPQNLHDCKTAVRWLRKNADRLHIDPDHIGVIGGSAGGHLAAMVVLTGPDAGLDPPGPYGEYSCRVQAGVDLYGPADLLHWPPNRPSLGMLPGTRAEQPELYRLASPTTHADKDDPPLLILHGTADKTVPVEQSELLAAALKQAGLPHELLVIPDAPHSFHLQPQQRDLRPEVLGFFQRYLKRT